MNKTKMYLKKFLYVTILIIFIFSMYDNIAYADSSSKTDENLTLYSKSSILIDSATGQILYEHNAYEKTYPASTTKLMTAILTLENCNLTDSVTVTKEAISGIPSGYTKAGLQAGENLTVDQLLHVLLIPSANDAANALACHIAGSIEDFSIMMNAKAKELGCQNTHFVNPSGIHDENHYSTAYDMSLIGTYANTFDTINQIVSETTCTLPNSPDGKERTFKTTDTLITPNNKYYYEYATGMKTGYTDKAKSCIVAKAKKDDIELICVVLGGDKTEDFKSERELDCHTLFDYGFNHFSYQTICSKDKLLDLNSLSDVPDILHDTSIAFSDDLNLLVDNNYSDTNKNISWKTDLQLPLYKNTVIGSITYDINGTNYTINLLLNEDVLPSGSKSVSSLFYILIIFLIIVIFITIFKKKRKNRFHRKSRSSRDEKYFRHSFY